MTKMPIALYIVLILAVLANPVFPADTVHPDDVVIGGTIADARLHILGNGSNLPRIFIESTSGAKKVWEIGNNPNSGKVILKIGSFTPFSIEPTASHLLFTIGADLSGSAQANTVSIGNNGQTDKNLEVSGAVEADRFELAGIGRLLRSVTVLEARSDEPVTPSVGTYLVLPTATGTSWSGEDNDWAIWSGSSWSFVSPDDGDLSLDLHTSTKQRWEYVDATTTWRLVGHRNPLAILAAVSLPKTLSGSEWNTQGGRSPHLLLTITDAVTDDVLTLPDPISLENPGNLVTIKNKSSAQIYLDVTGGDNIDGMSSVSVPVGDAVGLMVYFDDSGLDFLWTILFSG